MIEELSILKKEEDIRLILTFPSFEDKEYSIRIRELESLELTSILSYGNTRIGKTCILGKGCVGLAIPVIYRKKICALKVRRTDANRPHMYNEVLMHSLANSVNVGPTLIDFTENFILMEFIEGKNIFDWFSSEIIDKASLYQLIVSTLKQCYALDQIELDHGQLSCLKRHLIISSQGEPTIIDFESSSVIRKTTNVTSVVQNFISSPFFSNKFGCRLSEDKRKDLIQLLREYKKNNTKDRFVKVLDFFYAIC